MAEARAPPPNGGAKGGDIASPTGIVNEVDLVRKRGRLAGTK